MEPPIHVEYLRSGDAITRMLAVNEANSSIVISKRFDMLGNSVLPPANTILLYIKACSSLLHALITLNIKLPIPPSSDSILNKAGSNRISGA